MTTSKANISKVFVRRLKEFPLNETSWQTPIDSNVSCMKFDSSGYYCAVGQQNGYVSMLSINSLPQEAYILTDGNCMAQEVKAASNSQIVWSIDSSMLIRFDVTLSDTMLVMWKVTPNKGHRLGKIR